MHPYVLLPLMACVLCCTYCLTPYRPSYDAADRRIAGLAKLLFACPAVWAFCEVAFTVAPTPEAGQPFIAPLSLAMVMIGPISVHLSLRMLRTFHRGMRSKVVPLYFIAAGLVVVGIATGTAFDGLVETPWGYALDPGPLFPVQFGFIALCGAFTYSVCRRLQRESMSVSDEVGGKGIVGTILSLIVIGSLTDAVLPVVGIQVPRLATAGFAVLAGGLLWSSSRSGGYVFASRAIISREILRSIYEAVLFVNLENRILLANEGMGLLVGKEPEELIGHDLTELLPTLPIDDPEHRLDVETEIRTASGESVSVAASISTARDMRGSPLGAVVVLRDLREMNLLRSRLITSGRLAAVGQLAAGIAHEINNPISFVRTNLSVLREHWAAVDKEMGLERPPEPLREILNEGEEIITECIEGIDRAASIVRDVREFSHAGQPEREMTDLNELLDRVGRVAAPELGPGVTVERNYGRVPRVPASPQQLKQVFLNLFVNAIHAVSDDGKIVVSTECDEGFVCVSILDDGCGISAEARERIFDPFFTTKPVGEGTGLGLSISYEIVRNHGGELSLDPAGDGGTCFRVSLPLRDASS